jgi:peptidoglycan hydrolase-like protein with peptidoglycan-binding domain
MQKGDSGNNVKCLQQGLRIVCINPNGTDGVFGNGTENAVIKFQSKNELPATGVVNDATWNVLCEQIIPIQQGLINARYSIGTIDGIAGSVTYNSVLDFQSRNGLTADGMVGEGTKKLLFPDNQTTAAYVLSRGSKGESVRTAQLRLIALGYSCGEAGADGQFGNGTYYAVVAFQKQNGLTADGVIGKNTSGILFSENAVPYTSSIVLKKGMSGEQVCELQRKLIALGYSCGAAGADGFFGNATYYAVISFQKCNNLTQDGIAGSQTLAKLNSSDAISYIVPNVLKKGDSGEEVRQLQLRLISLDYTCGTGNADGIFGNGTYNSVCDFQRINDLSVDGVVGSNTRTVLFSEKAKRYEVLEPVSPIIVGTNDLVGYTIQVILNGEGNYTAINDNDPISIGILQWYQERAHDLLCNIKELNSKIVEDSLGNNSTLYEELSQDRSVFKGRYLGSAEKAALVILLGTEESHTVQDDTSKIDVAGYIEIGNSKGITDEKALIYFSDLYNQSPKQAYAIVEGISGDITLSKLHQGAMANTIMNQYVTRRENAYNAANIYQGSVSLEKFVDIALNESGTVEEYNNITKYGAWYGMDGQAWCAMFVSWCANQAGLLVTSNNANGIIPKYASVSLGMEWYKDKTRFGVKGSYIPKYGDIMFLKTGASHTAIVVGYDEDTKRVYTIEGNFSDKVCKVWRNANDSRITGYGVNGGSSYGYVLEDAISDAKGDNSTL